MLRSLRRLVADKIVAWLTREPGTPGSFLCDFERIRFEIRPADVLLIEGRTRVSDVIKTVTQSPWSHSALYLGRLSDIEDANVRKQVRDHYDGDDQDQLLLEALLGQGTLITPLKRYRHEHIRICRPQTLSPADAQSVIAFAVHHLGWGYDIRQLLDLARFLFPWSVLPRRWASTLFQHNAGGPTRTVCSSMLAAAFASVHYPIRPVIQRTEDGQLKLYRRNFRLFTPSDFDYSPYFDIIKYPYLGFDDVALYRNLPWDDEGVVCNAENDCFTPAEVLPEEGLLEDMENDEPVPKDGLSRRRAIHLFGRARPGSDAG
jgi:hypothetical protein